MDKRWRIGFLLLSMLVLLTGCEKKEVDNEVINNLKTEISNVNNVDKVEIEWMTAKDSGGIYFNIYVQEDEYNIEDLKEIFLLIHNNLSGEVVDDTFKYPPDIYIFCYNESKHVIYYCSGTLYNGYKRDGRPRDLDNYKWFITRYSDGKVFDYTEWLEE
ncbi:hypothetical protein [Ligaoa zhengdingensis]|uniref:hypothetical protein n=1 Tax=Ligaoa zhengdingensis TaxID=2763658 RepID=UPI0031B9DE97